MQRRFYQIRPQPRNEEVREILPADYRGVLVSDRGKSYDAQEFDGVAQQKCLAHLLRNVTDVGESKPGRARQCGATLKALLREGLALWQARRDLTPEDFRARSNQVEQQLTHHLGNRILRDDDHQPLLNGIGTQHARGHLLRFLKTEGVEPTNNRTERILRPAVIARKVSQCSKNQRGADTFAAFVSLAQTARKKAQQTISQALLVLFSDGSVAAAR